MKSWKTTLAGIGAATLYYLKTNGATFPTTKTEAINAGIAIALIAFGLVAKDSNVTGGTVSNQ